MVPAGAAFELRISPGVALCVVPERDVFCRRQTDGAAAAAGPEAKTEVEATPEPATGEEENDDEDGDATGAGVSACAGVGVGADVARVTGALLWDAAVVLAHHLIARPGLAAAGGRCVELGSGLGLAGLVAAASLGLHATLTDRAEVLPLMKRSISANADAMDRAGREGTAAAAVLPWGCATSADRLQPPFDLVLAADVVYALSLIHI